MPPVEAIRRRVSVCAAADGRSVAELRFYGCGGSGTAGCGNGGKNRKSVIYRIKRRKKKRKKKRKKCQAKLLDTFSVLW